MSKPTLSCPNRYELSHRQWERIESLLPGKAGEPGRTAVDKTRYRLRNAIERCFSKLKQFRRIATRYDRKAANFLSFVYLASLAFWVP